MGVLARFSKIMEANINDLLDRAENPEVMIKQYLLDYRKDLADIRTELSSVKADAKARRKEVEAAEAEIAKDLERAKKALAANNEEDAAALISRKQKNEGDLEPLRKAAALAASNDTRMTAMYNKLVADIETLEKAQTTIRATAAVTRGQETANKIEARIGSVSGTQGKVAELQNKAQQKLDRALAEAELNNPVEDPVDALAAKYDSGSSLSVSEELAALKASMGAPKADE